MQQRRSAATSNAIRPREDADARPVRRQRRRTPLRRRRSSSGRTSGNALSCPEPDVQSEDSISRNTDEVSSLAKKTSNDAPGMRGQRARTDDGTLREKRVDTHIGTIEQQYDLDLGVRSDMRWDTYKKRTGVESINDLVNGKGPGAHR